MTNDPLPCTKQACYVWQAYNTLERSPLVWWPLAVNAERIQNFYVWDFYIKWSKDYGTHARQRRVCYQHHQYFLEMFTLEMRQDVVEMELTEKWAIRNRGRI